MEKYDNYLIIRYEDGVRVDDGPTHHYNDPIKAATYIIRQIDPDSAHHYRIIVLNFGMMPGGADMKRNI